MFRSLSTNSKQNNQAINLNSSYLCFKHGLIYRAERKWKVSLIQLLAKVQHIVLLHPRTFSSYLSGCLGLADSESVRTGCSRHWNKKTASLMGWFKSLLLTLASSQPVQQVVAGLCHLCNICISFTCRYYSDFNGELVPSITD